MSQRAPFLPEVVLLFALCTLDMLSSAWLFHHRLAVEANPLLVRAAEAGVVPFVSAKLLTFVPALAVAEWYGRRRPHRIRPLLRWVAALYAGLYLLLVGAQFLEPLLG